MTWEEAWAKIDKISGLLHPGQEQVLYELARAAPAGANVLEIGPFKGRSTISLGYGCLDGRSGKSIFSIDTFRGKSDDTNQQGEQFFLGDWLKNVDDCGLIAVCTPLVGYSREYYEVWDKSIGLLFVDGGHDYETVKGDLDAFWPWLALGGVLAMHDVWKDDPNGRDTEKVWFEYIDKLTETNRFHNLSWGKKIVA